jgi:hypothetical protein
MSTLHLTAVPDWHADGLCQQVDPELFYPEKGETAKPAKAVCDRCDVRDKCLQWALDNDEKHGVWGGKTEKERRAMRPKAVAA